MYHIRIFLKMHVVEYMHKTFSHKSHTLLFVWRGGVSSGYEEEEGTKKFLDFSGNLGIFGDFGGILKKRFPIRLLEHFLGNFFIRLN